MGSVFVRGGKIFSGGQRFASSQVAKWHSNFVKRWENLRVLGKILLPRMIDQALYELPIAMESSRESDERLLTTSKILLRNFSTSPRATTADKCVKTNVTEM